MSQELTADHQNPKITAKVVRKVTDLLTSGEHIEYVAIQKAITSLSPDCIAATNKRIILCRPKNFGLSMTFEDYQWTEVLDCHIKEGIMSSTFFIQTVSRKRSSMDHLPKVQARKLYQVAQQREEEMAKYRRELEIEERRATAGGVVVNAALPLNQSPSNKEESVMEAMKNIKTLLESGLINREEFEAKRVELLSRL